MSKEERGYKLKVQQISLKERLQRIDSSYASDPAFNESAIKTFANIPIAVYLNGYPAKLNLLSQALRTSESEIRQLTYREVAIMVYQLRMSKRRNVIAYRAVEILMLPLRKCYEERKSAYGKNETDTP